MYLLITSPSAELCARALDDLRLREQINATVSVLSEALRRRGCNYPGLALCPRLSVGARWASRSRGNWDWALRYAEALCAERWRRWPKEPEHPMWPVIRMMPYLAAAYLRGDFPLLLTGLNSLDSNREFLRARWNEGHPEPPTWTNAEPPSWHRWTERQLELAL